MSTKRMVTSLWVIVGLACALLRPALAEDNKEDDNFDVLNYLQKKSDLIVVGKFITEPFGMIAAPGVKFTIVRGGATFQVDDVLKGDGKLNGQDIHVSFLRVALAGEKEEHTLYKKDTECILFLKYEEPGDLPAWMVEELKGIGADELEISKLRSRVNWNIVDWWFGVQPRNSAMERTLKGLSKKP